MNLTGKRPLALALVGASLLLLLPGIFLPVLTIRGVLTREGIAQVAPMMLEEGLNDETVAVLKSMMNPSVLGFIEATGGDVRKMVIEGGRLMSGAIVARGAEVVVGHSDALGLTRPGEGR